jgi:phosphoserine phosphatase
MKSVPTNKLNIIKRSIESALTNGANPVAAFDADGTIWDTDIGESFFKYQIKNGFAPSFIQDPLHTFETKFQQEPKKAFLWLAQINEGRHLEEIKQWSKIHFNEINPFPFFDSIRELIIFLQELKVKIYIVTASMKWAVEPAAAILDIPSENIIGISTKIVDGILTSEQEGILTWQEGKAQALLHQTTGIKPFLCAGNTMGDLALLEIATHIRFANCALPPSHTVYKSEQQLLAIAKSNNWFFHAYET